MNTENGCKEGMKTCYTGTWVPHQHSHCVGWRQLLVYFLQEHRHTALILSCLSMARSIDKQIVKNFLWFVVHSHLVALLVSRPTDAAVMVQCQDGVHRPIALHAPSQRCRHSWPFDPANQLHIFAHSHRAFAIYQRNCHKFICVE